MAAQSPEGNPTDSLEVQSQQLIKEQVLRIRTVHQVAMGIGGSEIPDDARSFELFRRELEAYTDSLPQVGSSPLGSSRRGDYSQ